MNTEVNCPSCGNVLLKQIEPLHGSIKVMCAECRAWITMSFNNGILIKMIYKENGGAKND